MLTGSQDKIGEWGHEYLRHLAGEISEEFSVSAVHAVLRMKE